MKQINNNLSNEKFENIRNQTCKNYVNLIGILFFGLLISIILTMQKTINDLKSKINNQNIDLFKEIKDNKNEYILSDSKIINNNIKYLIFLKSWINPNKIITSKLLYRLSKDGESIKTFHDKCDNISQTLILIESFDGKKFGGYTTCTWDGNMIDKNDNKTFLFNLNNNQKFGKRYNIFNNRDIYTYKKNGPYFGYRDLFFNPNMKFCNSYKSTQYSFLNDNNDLINNNNNTFEIKEVEIYQIDFN